MGLLSLGKPLSWEEIKANGYNEHIRRHGLIQFVNLYNKLKDRPCDVLKWGDEVGTKTSGRSGFLNIKGAQVQNKS